uniref:Protein FMC1 homolog n=1 Tax=Ciona savignyi TaxID=51511 RepID=H2YME3_CIOSA
MASAGRLQRLSTLRGILKEFGSVNASQNEATQFLMNKYKTHKVTDGKYCRQTAAATHDANTLYCLLRCTREYTELCDEHLSNEGTTVQAASRVGLKLPLLYQDEADGGGEAK